MKLNEYLKQARESLGKTQKEMAETCSTSINTIQNWETGKSIPQSTLWKTIISVYKLNHKKFMDLLSEEFNDKQAEEEKEFPDFLFENPEDITKLSLTEEEQELYSYLLLYNNYERNLYDRAFLPYQYVSRMGPINILNISDSLKAKLGKEGSLEEEFIRKQIKSNPDCVFKVNNVPSIDIYQLARKENKDLLSILEDIKDIQPERIKLSDKTEEKYIHKYWSWSEKKEKIFKLVDEKYKRYFKKNGEYDAIDHVCDEFEDDDSVNEERVENCYEAVDWIIQEKYKKYLTLVTVHNDDFKILYKKWLEDMKAYGENPELLEEPVRPVETDTVYLELTDLGKRVVAWYKENWENIKSEEKE